LPHLFDGDQFGGVHRRTEHNGNEQDCANAHSRLGNSIDREKRIIPSAGSGNSDSFLIDSADTYQGLFST
jgi:hypothetical protein